MLVVKTKEVVLACHETNQALHGTIYHEIRPDGALIFVVGILDESGLKLQHTVEGHLQSAGRMQPAGPAIVVFKQANHFNK